MNLGIVNVPVNVDGLVKLATPLIVTLIGLGALVILPVAQYPEIVPPTVQITTVYPGASADVVSKTVATPLEQSVNGVESGIVRRLQLRISDFRRRSIACSRTI